MVAINPDIKPTGMQQRDFVDALYMLTSSLEGICAKLDADGGVPLTTYTANCITAIFNCSIKDSRGNSFRNGQSGSSTIEGFHSITPNGIGDAALNAWMYQFFNSLETLTEQLDADGLTFNNYEATAYTATMTQRVENGKGNTLGNGTTTYKFKPNGMWNVGQLVEFLYNAINSINLLCTNNTSTGLDGDGTVTDTNYAALWYTANILMRVENGAGNTVGNSSTRYG